MLIFRRGIEVHQHLSNWETVKAGCAPGIDDRFAMQQQMFRFRLCKAELVFVAVTLHAEVFGTSLREEEHSRNHLRKNQPAQANCSP
jgi:hypothetical protein